MWANKQSKCLRRQQHSIQGQVLSWLILVYLLRPPSSPSQRCKVYTQKGVMPATPPLSSHTLAQDGQATDALTSDSMHLSTCLCFNIVLMLCLKMHVWCLWCLIFLLHYFYLSILLHSLWLFKLILYDYQTIARCSPWKYSSPLLNSAVTVIPVHYSNQSIPFNHLTTENEF